MNTPKTKARKPKPSPFHRLRVKVGLADKARCAELCGVTERTIENWDKKGAPFIAERLLHLYDKKDCGGVGPSWTGFLFSRGRLVNTRHGLIFDGDRLKLWPSVLRQLERLEAQAPCPMRHACEKARRAEKAILSALRAAREALTRLAGKTKGKANGGGKW